MWRKKMKDETIDLVIKFAILKTYNVQVSQKNEAVNDAIVTVESKIQKAIEKEKKEEEAKKNEKV